MSSPFTTTVDIDGEKIELIANPAFIAMVASHLGADDIEQLAKAYFLASGSVSLQAGLVNAALEANGYDIALSGRKSFIEWRTPLVEMMSDKTAIAATSKKKPTSRKVKPSA
jgi:hypothetical protein